MTINQKEKAAKCREIRIRSGHTQAEVAKMTGYNQRTISQFELGKNNNMILYSFYTEILAKF